MWIESCSPDDRFTDDREDTMTTTTETAFDSAKAEAFGGHMMSILAGSLLSSMVDIGHRTGLFAAAAEG